MGVGDTLCCGATATGTESAPQDRLGQLLFAEWGDCRRHWSGSIPEPHASYSGSSCLRLIDCHAPHGLGCCDDIICIRIRSQRTCVRQSSRRKFTSTSVRMFFAIVLLFIYCVREPTFARSKSCLVTQSEELGVGSIEKVKLKIVNF